MDLEEAKTEEVESDVKIFFHEKTLIQILALRTLLLKDESDEGIFLNAQMCGIIHGSSRISLSLPCSHSFSMSPTYVKRYAKKHRLERPVRNVLKCLEMKAEKSLADGLPCMKGKVYNEDATEIPLEKESVDLIMTSPPYFNKQTYSWDNWLRLWFLGHNYRDVGKELFSTGSKARFVEFMTKALEKMFELLRDDTACFIVIGDVKLNGETINTAELLVQPAESVGFKVKRIIDDPIRKGKKYFMFVPPGKGVRIDRIVELNKGTVQERNVSLPWDSNSRSRTYS